MGREEAEEEQKRKQQTNGVFVSTKQNEQEQGRYAGKDSDAPKKARTPVVVVVWPTVIYSIAGGLVSQIVGRCCYSGARARPQSATKTIFFWRFLFSRS